MRTCVSRDREKQDVALENPFLGGAVVLAHLEARRLPREQTRRIAANLAVVTLVLGGLLLSAALSRRSQAQATPSSAVPSEIP
jgi:hypothetical protein